MSSTSTSNATRGSLKAGWARCALWALGSLYVLAAGLQIYSCVVTRDALQSELPKNFGNFARVRASLAASDANKPFTFAVVGDPRSSATFEALAKDINKAQPAFVVILGDWVNDGTMNQHAYFKRKAPDYGLSCPVFFTPGNHDVDPVDYPLTSFERDYGPRNYSFVYNDSIFIFISHLDKRFSNQESLDYLRSLDKKTLSAYRNRFVFMHIPPWVSPDMKERHTADENELMQIFEDLKIDYVVAADFHGYNRTCLRGVEYVVTGGGGGRLHDAQWPQFHHAIALTVGQDMASERIMPASSRFSIKKWIDMNSIVYVGPFLNDHYFVVIVANLVFLFLFFAFFKSSWKSKGVQ